MSHDVHVRVLHGDNSGIREETLKPGLIPDSRYTSEIYRGGDAETRDNPVYLALIPEYREETLKPGIIPGNPVYLAGMQIRLQEFIFDIE